MRPRESGPPRGDAGGRYENAAAKEVPSVAIVSPGGRPSSSDTLAQQRDRDAAVTAKSPAERAAAYRRRRRDALTADLVTPQTVTAVTPDVTFAEVVPARGMTKTERDELARIVRQRAKVAKSQANTREAELRADVEAKLAAEFDAYDEHWADIRRHADRAVAEADAAIAELCRERGVPADFRPSLRLEWYLRGANASAARRSELRKLAEARITQSGRAARLHVEALEAETLARLFAGGLASAASLSFLAELPDPRALMPSFGLDDLAIADGAR